MRITNLFYSLSFSWPLTWHIIFYNLGFLLSFCDGYRNTLIPWIHLINKNRHFYLLSLAVIFWRVTQMQWLVLWFLNWWYPLPWVHKTSLLKKLLRSLLNKEKRCFFWFHITCPLLHSSISKAVVASQWTLIFLSVLYV